MQYVLWLGLSGAGMLIADVGLRWVIVVPLCTRGCVAWNLHRTLSQLSVFETVEILTKLCMMG